MAVSTASAVKMTYRPYPGTVPWGGLPLSQNGLTHKTTQSTISCQTSELTPTSKPPSSTPLTLRRNLVMFCKPLSIHLSPHQETTSSHISVRILRSSTPRRTSLMLKRANIMSSTPTLQTHQRETTLFHISERTRTSRTPRVSLLLLRRSSVMSSTPPHHQMILQETTSFHTSVKTRTSLSPRETSPMPSSLLELGPLRETEMVLGFFQELMPTSLTTTRLRTPGHLTRCHPSFSSILTWMPPLTFNLIQSAPPLVALSTSTRRRHSVTKSTMLFQTSAEITTSTITSPP